MCIHLFLGSGQSLPYSQWLPLDCGIGVHEVRDQPWVTEVFSTPHVYWVGTHRTGDGCGFQGDYSEARQARAELASLLEGALTLVPEVELFVAWHDVGLSRVVPSKFDWIGPSDIRTWRSLFTPDEFLMIVREG